MADSPTPAAQRAAQRRARFRAEGRCPRCGQVDVAWLDGTRRYQHCTQCRRAAAARCRKVWRSKVRTMRCARVCQQCQIRPIALIGRVQLCAECRRRNKAWRMKLWRLRQKGAAA